MPARTVVYGNIVDADQRRSLNRRMASHRDSMVWYDTPRLFELNDTPATVFVDLDKAAFADPQFLISLASAGERVSVVGKLDEPSVDAALRVSKLGVSELLNSEQCLQRLESILKELEEVPPEANLTDSRFTAHALIGRSPQMDRIRETIRLLADVDFPSALILGDTGTGKSLISKILHNSGVRARHNLVEVNCSAIPDDLFESELFGHIKGAFTDAKAEKPGLFEYAEGGTLFLDEVGNLSASAQAKLLKIVEDKKLRKVGTVDEKDINVRVVAATNLDLKQAIEKGAFREDLYFRLNLLTVEIPPLCERTEDIPELIEYYLAYYSTNYGKPGLEIEQKTLELLSDYAWPGNVRELCNVIERAVLLNRTGTITRADISVALKKARITAGDRQELTIRIPPQGISLQQVEQEVVKQVLNMVQWNKSEAARFLNISRPRLRRIIEAAGLEQNRRES